MIDLKDRGVGATFRHWQWNELEAAAFDDQYYSSDDGRTPERLTAREVVLYLRGIRMHMDFATGITGRARKVSYKQFRELLEERPKASSNRTAFFPTNDHVRHMLKQLERVGLIRHEPRRRKTDPLVFFLPLAKSDLNRSAEEPQRSPKGGDPKVVSLKNNNLAGVNPRGTPKGEPHTSEYPNKDIVFTSVNTVEKPKKSTGSLAWWRKLFLKASESSFLVNSRFFDLDWLLKADNFRKVIEGNFSE